MLREQIWTGMIDSSRTARYSAELQVKYSRIQQRWEWGTLGLFVFIALTLAALVLFEEAVIAAAVSVLSGSAGAFFAWQARQRWGIKAVIAEFVATQYTLLLDDWTRLWYQDEPDPSEVALLRTKYTCLGSYLSDAVDTELIRKAAKEANSDIRAQFGEARNGKTAGTPT